MSSTTNKNIKAEDHELKKLQMKQEILQNKKLIRELRMKNESLQAELSAINRLKMNPNSLLNIFKSKYHVRTKTSNQALNMKQEKKT